MIGRLRWPRRSVADDAQVDDEQLDEHGADAATDDPAADLPTEQVAVIDSGIDDPPEHVIDELLSFFRGDSSPREAPAGDESGDAAALPPPDGRQRAEPISEPTVPPPRLLPDVVPPAPSLVDSDPSSPPPPRRRRGVARLFRRRRRDATPETPPPPPPSSPQVPSPTAPPPSDAAVPTPADGSGADVSIIVADESAATPNAATIPDPPRPAGAGDDAANTVTIVDAGDLPDAVYLEGSLEAGDGAPRRVFIDDHDPDAGALVTMDVAVGTSGGASVEPRVRDRRLAVQRAVMKKRVRLVILGVAVVAVIIGALALAGSGVFSIDTVRLDGAVYSQGDELDAIVEDLRGQNVLTVDTGEYEQLLERLPWVDAARVTTDFPSTATIEIAERRPIVFFAGSDGRFRVLDKHGRVLAVLDGQPIDYLQLVVDDGPNTAAGHFAPEGYRAAARLASMFDAPLADQVMEIHVDAAGDDLRLILAGEIEVLFGDTRDLVDKLVRLNVALLDPNPDNAPTEQIDVSTADYVVR